MTYYDILYIIKNSDNLIVYDGNKPVIPSITDSSLLIDYIYLDKDERNLFSKIGHEKSISHLLNSPGNFTLSKLIWIKKNKPDIYEKIEKVLDAMI